MRPFTRHLPPALSLLCLAGCYASHERALTTADGGTDATATPRDAGHDAPPRPTVDSGPGCAPAGELVRIPGAHAYGIEATEVTQSAYARFLRCTAPVDPTPSCPATEIVPLTSDEYPYDPERLPDSPVRWVTWCAATAYCAWEGRRLCTLDEWRDVCLATQARVSTDDRGTIDDPNVCVLSAYADGEWSFAEESDHPEPVRSAPECRGLEPPYDQVFDMVGNMLELVTVPRAPPSLLVGSSYVWARGSGCLNEQHIDPDGRRANVGFRCCAD